MKPKKRQKLCPNCDGEVDVDVIVCPFCAADLRESPSMTYSSDTLSDSGTLETSQTQRDVGESLYPFRSAKKTSSPAVEGAISPSNPVAESLEIKGKNIFTPTILFTTGVQLCLLGLLMLLFSHKGVVMLKWDARFWVFYVMSSLPFLAFGYRALSKL